MYYANSETLSTEVLDPVQTADPELARLCIDLTSVTELVGEDAFFPTTGSVVRAYLRAEGAGPRDQGGG